MKHIIPLYLIGIALLAGTVGFFASVGYETNGLREEISKIKTELKEAEDREVKFKQNLYEGVGLLMSGQSQLAANQNDLNIAVLRIHHFVSPHAEQFYDECPECQLEKESIQATDNNKTTLNN